MLTDYVLNGRAFGQIGEQLEGIGWDVGMLRPYWHEHQGRTQRMVTINTGKRAQDGKPIRRPVPVAWLIDQGHNIPSFIMNATTLRKAEWIQYDQAVLRAYRERLSAWADLQAAVPVGGFDAMGKTTYEYEAMSDPLEAVIDMDGLTDARNDQPLFSLRSLPLPITHADWGYSQRQLATTRNGGSPLGVTLPEAAGRRVAESIEQQVLGVAGNFSYGLQSSGYAAHESTIASTVWGYTTYPYRNTKTNLTVPTGANPNATVTDVLAMLNTMYDDKRYGPFMLYHSTDWDQYLDHDYSFINGTNWAANPSQTLRERIKKIPNIQDVRRLDFLTPAASHAFVLILVQMTSDVVQAINGMEITTVQWEEKGGLKLGFKAMAIKVPLFKSDYNNLCGILHARTA